MAKIIRLFLRCRVVFRTAFNYWWNMELVFSVSQEEDGGFVAECLSHDIFTEADDWGQLRANVREAVTAFFYDQTWPSSIRLHLVRDELLAVA